MVFFYKRIVTIIITLTMLFHLTACFGVSNNSSKETPNVLLETYLDEEFLYEELLYEHNLSEEYLEEKILLDSLIVESLLHEEIIEEVYFIDTILIPEEQLFTDFDITLVNELFGHGVDLSSLLTKFSIGAGVILTLVILNSTIHAGKVAALIASARQGSQSFAGAGSIIGTISGAVLGAADSIDETGRLRALTEFGMNIAGLILTSLTLFTAIAPSGIPLLIMAAGFLATAWTSYSSFGNLVETYKTTDNINIDWENINWDEVGYSTAARAIEGAADGFMIGAIVGAVYGAARSVTKFQNKTVIMDDSTFDPHLITNGRSNIQRMRDGHSPIGYDGRPVNIHHIDQTNTGAVMEIQESIHRSNHSKLHSNTGQSPSLIDRPEFDLWRADYWKSRATQFS
ncbi:MAG: HNH/ENDO VII family nuclease [Oscillospiraceae bacterium]|nr:HNH/ENDO VII family nuclease [Oscillospiraceae bacterium]